MSDEHPRAAARSPTSHHTVAPAKGRKGVKLLGYTDPRGFEYALIDVDLLVPDQGNYRIPTQESTLDTLIAIVQENPDFLFALASDLVAQRGGNPAELLNVTPAGDQFVVKEGNRRLTARRLLKNPEQLRGRVSDEEYNRWAALSKDEGARSLPKSLVAVIGADHETWVDRRHLGLQDGVGLVPWNTRAKTRRTGKLDRAEQLLNKLKSEYPERFSHLDPPRKTFTTFQRLLDSSLGLAHIGYDLEEDGTIRLNRGERSLRLLEEALGDLQRTDKNKLTSRKIHDRDAIEKYLGELDARVGEVADDSPIRLTGVASTTGAGGGSTQARPKRPKRAVKHLNKPNGTRPARLYDELYKAVRDDMPNAAIILTRVVLELLIDQYATAKSLSIGADRDAAAEAEVKAFREAVGRAKIQIPRVVAEALKRAGTKSPTLGDKLRIAIDALIAEKKIDKKEGQAKKRELASKEIVESLHDAVHRLHTAPSVDRVLHVHEVVALVFNALAEG